MSPFARTDRGLLANWWWTLDRALLSGLLVIALVGVVMVFASSPPIARRLGYEETRFIVKHITFLLPAILLLLGTSLLAPRGILRVALLLLAGFGLLLLLTPFVAAEIKGARRWVSVGGLLLQPSEFVKPALVVVTGWLLARRPGLRGAPEAAALCGLVLLLLVIQPDLGMTALVAAVFGIQLFVAGLPWLLIGGLAGLAGAGLYGAYLVFPHVQTRIDDFLDPSRESYQVEASLSAVSSGGLFGRGPGEGVVKFYLPEAHSDFVFATLAEEFGAIAALLVLMLFGFVVLRGLWRAYEARDRFVQLAAVGLLAQFGLQALVNIAVNLNLLPTKGMTLPFVSYGGSSLLALAIGMGMLLALTRVGARLEGAP